MPWMAAVAAAAPVVTSMIGQRQADEDRKAAEAARQAALAQIMGIEVPTLEQQRILLEKYQSAGDLAPTMEGTEVLGPSDMASVSTDPRLKSAQLAALAQMQGLGQGGLTLQDRIDAGDINRNLASDAQSRDKAILANMAARGVGGSGAELATRLASNQSGMNQASQEGARLAAQAQARALQAIAQSGSMAGSMNDQEFAQSSAKAQAADEISRFNTANRQGVSGRNTSAQNEAKRLNLANAQDVLNRNTGTANQQEQYNKELYGKNYDRRFRKAAAASNALSGNAASSDASGDKTEQMWGGIGQGIGGAASAFGSASQKSDDRSFAASEAAKDRAAYGAKKKLPAGYGE